jgi:predicted nucleotidyltransferase
MTKLLRSRLAASPQQIAEICRQHEICELAVFGSVLREDFSTASDIDLLVSFQPDASPGFLELARARRELEGLLGRKVDLVPKKGLKPIIRDEILAAAEPLYEV